MKNIFFFLFVFFFIISSNLKAQIAYIDINFILKTSEVGKHLNSYIEQKFKQHTKKYKEIESGLIIKEKTLISQQNILNEEEFENKFNILSNEVKKYKKDKQADIESLNKFKIDNTKEILKVINPIITNFVDLNSISIVIPKKNIIVGKKNLDITDQILKLLNKSITELNF